MEYLSEIIKPEEIQSIQPGKFNILKAPRGAGKTTFMFDERILSFARDKKHVIYLIHNKMSRDAIVAKHGDKAIIYENNLEWLWNRTSNSFGIEQDEDYVHVMCYQTFSALLKNHGTDWLDDIDLIVWDEFDDIRKYLMKEVNELKKKLPNFSQEKITALLEEGNGGSLSSFIYKIKNVILDPARITLLAISATPELAGNLFADYLNYIIQGKIENVFDAQQTLYIESVANALQSGLVKPGEGHKFWCYTKYINSILRIETLAREAGFNVLSLWSRDNPNYKQLWTEEKTIGFNSIMKEGLIPPQYDFVIVNEVVGRSIDVVDTNYQDWICNSCVYEDVGQFIRARFSPERKYLLKSTKPTITIDVQLSKIPAIYYDWHTVPELRELLKSEPLYDDTGKAFLIWNQARKFYEDKLETRVYGRKQLRQYRFKSSS